jgi:TRAP-type C4-dicarboxylate transport system permease small subunit
LIPRPRGWLARTLRWLHAAEQAAAAIAILSAAAALISDLLGRELFGAGLFGAQRAAVHLTFVAGMLGFVLATARGEHLRIKATDHLLPAHWEPRVTRAGDLVSWAILWGLAWSAWNFAMETRGVGERSVTLGIPLWPIQMVMVYAFFSSGLRYLAYAWMPALRPGEESSAA